VWTPFPGAALDVGAGADGTLYVIGTNGGIFRWTGSTWDQLPGAGVRIAVGPTGDPWIVNKDNAISQWTGSTWKQLPGAGTDIGVGADGSAWVIGTNAGVYQWTGSAWSETSGAGARIAVGPTGDPWLVNKENAIFRWTGSTWDELPGAGTDIGVGADGSACIIGTDGKVYQWTGSTWGGLGDTGVCISVVNVGSALVANSAGAISQYTASATLLPTPTRGNTNYLLADSDGGAVTGTTVTITVVEDIVPDNVEAYSFQINCNSPSQPSGAAPFVWQQYGFAIAANELFFWVNCYRQQDLPGSPHIQWDSRPPRMPNNTGVVSLANNTLPKGWQLTTTLVTDANSNVTGFTFSIAQPGGTVLNSPTVMLTSLNTSSDVSGNLAPILNFQAILVGENGGHTTDFEAGGSGIFLCYATKSLTATASEDESGEGSNVGYSSLPASYPGGEFYQFVSVG
jgi:tectonin-like protein